jgi:hypothetical protein
VTESRSAQFTFNDAPATAGFTFKCKITGTGGFDFTPCSSTDTFSGLGTGPHTFSVEAVDTTSSKNVSAAASSGSWTVVDASISLSPATGTNEVGKTSNSVTCTIKQDTGSGPAAAPNGTPCNWSITAGPNNTQSNSCNTTGGTGTCTFAYTGSGTPGIDTIHASTTFTVDTVSLSRSTLGSGTDVSGDGLDVTQTWVDARIKIEGTAANKVGSAHTFTVTFEQNDGTHGWQPVPVGNKPTVTITPAAPSSVTNNCALTGTDVSGVCTVQINSTSPGVFTANVSGSVTVGGVPLTRDTDSSSTPPCGGGTTCGPAVKTYVDARISIGTSGTAQVGNAQTYTVTVEQNDGTGWTNASGVTITPASAGVGSVTGGTCQSGTTNNSGQCTIVVNSSTPGTETVDGSGTVTVSTVPIGVATNGYGADSISNTQTWVA